MQFGSEQRTLDAQQQPIIRVVCAIRSDMLMPLFACFRYEVEVVELA
jgi:hypothetical protein